MKRDILFSLVPLLLILFTASDLHAGYRLEPWGSKTWTGAGRPHHWSPKADNSVTHRQSVRPDQRFQKSYRYDGKGRNWKNKHNRWHKNRYRRFGNIHYQNYPVRRVIIEREKRIPVIIHVPQNPTKLRCAGNTITRNDPKTGAMIIEYVTSAGDC